MIGGRTGVFERRYHSFGLSIGHRNFLCLNLNWSKKTLNTIIKKFIGLDKAS